MTGHIDDIAARVEAGEPLSEPDIAALAATTDILTLGMLADGARQRRHGATTTFVRVADVQLPIFGAVAAIPRAAREIRVRGPIEAFDTMLLQIGGVVEAAGTVPVSACSLADLESYAAASGTPLADVLRRLRQVGIRWIAEAPIDRMRDPERALTAVHEAGLDLARLTVQHQADAATRLTVIRRAADLQRALGWIRSFAPLPRSWDVTAPSTGYDDVRQVALTRLLAANIPSIQVDWPLYGPKLAQVALTVGADDVDGVSALDDAGEGRRRAPIEEIRRNITAAALVPIERDGAYQRIGG